MTPDGCVDHVLARRDEDGTAALEALAAGLPDIRLPERPAPASPSEDVPLTLDHIGLTVAALLPEGALIADEMVSSAGVILNHLKSAAAHEFMPVAGGSIGQGLPVAVGAAIACPDRKIVSLEADGSAMYTLQALWTMARERLDVTVVILANRRYRILDIEMQRTGARGFGRMSNDMIDIGRPDLDFVKLSAGLGVEASRATTARAFTDQFRDALQHRGPRLIEAAIG